MFLGFAWFLHRLIKTFFYLASKLSSFSGKYSRYSYAVTTKLNHLQEKLFTLQQQYAWRELAKNVSGTYKVNFKKKLELRQLELPLRKF